MTQEVSTLLDLSNRFRISYLELVLFFFLLEPQCLIV